MTDARRSKKKMERRESVSREGRRVVAAALGLGRVGWELGFLNLLYGVYFNDGPHVIRNG
jgi:hypothetical protein